MLLSEIQQGESKKLEFKAQLIDNKKLAKTIIAFSNTSGGKLLIGVDDQSQVIGVDKQLVAETIRNLERTRENLGYDEEINPKLTRSPEAEAVFFKDFEAYTGKIITENDLLNLKLLKPLDGQLTPTNAYGLFISLDYYQHGLLKCARFKGITTSHFIDRKEIELPIHKQIEQAMAFAKSHVTLGSTLVDARRIDRYVMPMDAVREAIANAVTHRDYSRQSSQITLNIFDNRLELTSPGELVGMLDVSQIKQDRSEIRNRVVARILNKMGFIEAWGTGITRMMDLSQVWGVQPPVFEEIGQSFRVTLFKDADFC